MRRGLRFGLLTLVFGLVAVEAFVLVSAAFTLKAEGKWRQGSLARFRQELSAAPHLRNFPQKRVEDLYIANAWLGYRLAPNSVAFDSTGFFVTDANGFLATNPLYSSVTKQKAPDHFRILVLGGSTVMGVGAKHPEESLPSQLRLELTKRFPKKHFEVINAGVPGYRTSQEILWYWTELHRYEPDLVIFYGGVNDFYYLHRQKKLQGTDFLPHLTLSHLQVQNQLEGLASVRRSGTYFLQALRAKLPLIGEIVSLQTADVASAQKEAIVYDPAVTVAFHQSLEQALFLSQQQGARVALFLQPAKALHDIDEDHDGHALRTFYKEASKIYATLRRDQKSGKSLVSDLSLTLKDHHEFFTDYVHLGLDGNRLVAQRMAEALSRGGLLPR